MTRKRHPALTINRIRGAIMAYRTMAKFSAYFNDPEYVDAALARIERRITVTTNGCHECDLGMSERGYSRVSFGDVPWRTHRLMWSLKNGELPSGMVIDHLCRNRKCCNPDHLEPVTIAENNKRSFIACGRKPAAPIERRPRKRSHCPHGHEFLESDVLPNGFRKCGRCIKERYRQRYETDPDFRMKERLRKAAAQARYRRKRAVA